MFGVRKSASNIHQAANQVTNSASGGFLTDSSEMGNQNQQAEQKKKKEKLGEGDDE